MTIKLIPISDTSQSVALSSYSFIGDYNSYPLSLIEPAIQTQNALGLYEGDSLLAQLFIVPFQMNVHGAFYQMGGIATVSTYPESRGLGATKSLLIDSLKLMKERGQSISVLGPFSIPFYRKIGYEVYFENVTYTIPIESLIFAEPSSGFIERVTPDDTQVMSEIQAFYESLILHHNGLSKRDASWWKKLNDIPNTFYATTRNKNKTVTGFIRYKIKEDTFYAMDWFAENRESYQLLIHFIYRHRSQISKAKVTFPSHLSFFSLLANPEIDSTIAYDCMVRIVDIQSFLSCYPFRSIEKPLRVTINDAQAEWNHQTFEISSKGTVRALGSNQTNKGLEMAIGPFSAMMMGFHTIDWYRSNDQIASDKAIDSEWKQSLPTASPWFHDHF